ncbi:hypothetical protein VMCG_00105 [Cytospora schulzeri]|uniref:Uncharacterized protein n=1 Tax=Cytospora schulzeri TaxID=448051 RepID=A0A423X8W0_9PEZI|nr:hypothetical protein VMCG_00105 [Valsa malicola]
MDIPMEAQIRLVNKKWPGREEFEFITLPLRRDLNTEVLNVSELAVQILCCVTTLNALHYRSD